MNFETLLLILNQQKCPLKAAGGVGVFPLASPSSAYLFVYLVCCSTIVGQDDANTLHPFSNT